MLWLDVTKSLKTEEEKSCVHNLTAQMSFLLKAVFDLPEVNKKWNFHGP